MPIFVYAVVAALVRNVVYNYTFSAWQENAAGGAVKEDRPVMTAADATVVSHALSLSEPKGNEQPELLTNEIIVGKVKTNMNILGAQFT